jgi:GWxTD domain-containing protein
MARSAEVSGTGVVQAARLDLGGLPPGEYRLVLDARTPSGDARREASFTMAEMQTEALAHVALRAATQPTAETRLAERYFQPAARGDSAIDAMIRALELVPPGGSVPSYVRGFDYEAKRRFLARYWAGLDPDPATPTHELLDDYVRRMDYAIREYSEGRIGRLGVETDRGRIYLKYGPPDVKIERPLTNDRGVESWRYTQQRDLLFLFVDETGVSGMGQYRLVYTTDPNEVSLPDWTSRIGDSELIREIFNY